VRSGVVCSEALPAEALSLCFLAEDVEDAVFLGCDATRPLFSGVPVMKTLSLS
jgi:hypothetical protein